MFYIAKRLVNTYHLKFGTIYLIKSIGRWGVNFLSIGILMYKVNFNQCKNELTILKIRILRYSIQPINFLLFFFTNNHSWSTSRWTSCSRTCGTGKKSRNVYCSLSVDNEEFILPSSQCKEHEKPIELMSCNAQQCPAEWFARPFGEVHFLNIFYKDHETENLIIGRIKQTLWTSRPRDFYHPNHFSIMVCIVESFNSINY